MKMTYTPTGDGGENLERQRLGSDRARGEQKRRSKAGRATYDEREHRRREIRFVRLRLLQHTTVGMERFLPRSVTWPSSRSNGCRKVSAAFFVELRGGSLASDLPSR